MANFPMGIIPVAWQPYNSTTIIHNGSRLAIHESGEMALDGNVKDAALGLVKYVVEREYFPGLVEIQLNKALSIDCENGFSLSYIGEKKPEFWDELVREFDRAVKMKAFW